MGSDGRMVGCNEAVMHRTVNRQRKCRRRPSQRRVRCHNSSIFAAIVYTLFLSFH